MAAVGLDISTNCGVAFWPKALARPLFSTLKLVGEPGELGRPMEKLRSHLSDLHRSEAITHLFFEATILPGTTSIQAINKLCALCGMAEWFGYRIEAHTRQVLQQSWRKHFIGRGTGKTAELKRLAVAKCHAMGWDVTDDHQAEAIGVLDFGLTCAGVTIPWRDLHLFAGAGAAKAGGQAR